MDISMSKNQIIFVKSVFSEQGTRVHKEDFPYYLLATLSVLYVHVRWFKKKKKIHYDL